MFIPSKYDSLFIHVFTSNMDILTHISRYSEPLSKTCKHFYKERIYNCPLKKIPSKSLIDLYCHCTLLHNDITHAILTRLLKEYPELSHIDINSYILSLDTYNCISLNQTILTKKLELHKHYHHQITGELVLFDIYNSYPLLRRLLTFKTLYFTTSSLISVALLSIISLFKK